MLLAPLCSSSTLSSSYPAEPWGGSHPSCPSWISVLSLSSLPLPSFSSVVGGCCFQAFHVVQVLNANRYLLSSNSCVMQLLGSSKAKTNEDDVLALYIAGGLTQLGLCMMLSAVYWWLSAISASWHMSIVHGLHLLSAPVGTLLIRILNHLLFAVMHGVLGRSWMEGNFVTRQQLVA